MPACETGGVRREGVREGDGREEMKGGKGGDEEGQHELRVGTAR